MSTTRHRLALLVTLVSVVLLVGAAPAGAATTVLANEKYKWFYWAGPLIAVGLLGVLAAVGVGYYVRVMRPKWRGRQSS